MPVLRRTLVLVTLAAGLVLSEGSPTSASCALPVPRADALARADAVVVGTVTATRSADRIATVTVEDIWKGNADLVIEVAGGPDSPNMRTSVDRTFEVGTRYLFFLLERTAQDSRGTFGAFFEDNSCTNTRPYTTDLDTLRPSTARRVATSSPTSPTPPRQNDPSGGDHAAFVVRLGAVAAIAAVAAALPILWRRQSAAQRSR